MALQNAVKPEHLVYLEDLDTATANCSNLLWRGYRIQQPVLDLWVIQEALSLVKPALVIETGTKYGGSAMYYADLLTLLGGGRVLTVDMHRKHAIQDPRIEFVIGDSVKETTIQAVRAHALKAEGPVAVILDSGHSQAHVSQEMELYAPLVTKGSFMLVQDGIIDILPRFASLRPGPLRAIEQFRATHPEFTYSIQDKFLITYHPMGWLWKS